MAPTFDVKILSCQLHCAANSEKYCLDNLPNGKGRFVALKQPKILGPNKPCFATLPIIEAIIGTL